MNASRDPFSVNLSDYDFDLPAELIAAFPSEQRGDDRLMVLDRNSAEPEHRHFSDLPAYLRAGDLLVLNDVRVRRLRLHARKLPGGGAAALLLIKPRTGTAENGALWECLIDTHRALRPGQKLALADGTRAELVSRDDTPGGSALVRFDRVIDSDFLDHYGEMPLPPYILKRRAEAAAHTHDGERYQTVYADQGTALAAPTAGLHFTREMLALLERSGVRIARLTLDVGWGTFAPIRTDDIRAHTMHAESFTLTPRLVQEVLSAKQEARRVVAVGTTVVRALESAASHAALDSAQESGALSAGRYTTDLFIMPGYRFRVIDALLTNFHTPRSSLLVLVSAFAGRERVLAAYTGAMARGYRFFSYGDAMLMV